MTFSYNFLSVKKGSFAGNRPARDLLLMSKSRQKDIPQTPERLSTGLKSWLLTEYNGKYQFLPKHPPARAIN